MITPLQRGLNESFVLSEEVNKVEDSNGDRWVRHDDLYRNETHPHWDDGAKNVAEDEGGNRFETLKRSGWQNLRTNEVHEGDMRLGPDGKACCHSHYGEPRLFSADHYFKVENDEQ